MIKAARYQPTIWTADDLEDVDRKQLGLKGSPTIVSKYGHHRSQKVENINRNKRRASERTVVYYT